MAEDPFKALKEAPYPLFVAPRDYSFDLNEDMIQALRDEFNAEIVAPAFAEIIKGKAKGEIAKIGKEYFEDYGERWMSKVIQLAEEYSDRTYEMILETVDKKGEQFLLFPHVAQRYVEIAYLGTQPFLKVPIILNWSRELGFRIPQCILYSAIQEKTSDDVAKLMCCQHGCLTGLEAIRRHMDVDVIIDMPKSTAADGFCEFIMRKL